MATKQHPLSLNLRKKAQNIGTLLKEYIDIRYGDETYRRGDEKWRSSQGKEGIPPGKGGKPPKIVAVSTPRNIYAQDETSSEPPNNKENKDETEQKNGKKELKIAFNPLFTALQNMGELDETQVATLQLDNRFNILQDLGVVERLNCSALFRWLRRMAAQVTYILETRELYSTEIKAIYPELLNDLEVARSTCDQLAYTLSNQSGILTGKQQTQLLAKLLHYAKVAQQAALQLADHHEAFITAETTPFEGPEVEWVFEKEAPLKPKEEKPKEEEK